MAGIRKTSSGWRAELYRYGHRTSKHFKSKGEAQAWIKSAEPAFVATVSDLPKVVVAPGAENVPLHLTESDIVRRAKPYAPTSGVYFLVLDGRVVYVGQSVDVHGRIVTHSQSKKFDAIHFLPCPVGDLRKVEAEYIRRLSPPLNIAGKLIPVEGVEVLDGVNL